MKHHRRGRNPMDTPGPPDQRDPGRAGTARRPPCDLSPSSGTPLRSARAGGSVRSRPPDHAVPDQADRGDHRHVWPGFSFQRYADRDARSTARQESPADLVDLLRRNIDNPWQPPGAGGVGALSHDVIHGLDVTEALACPYGPATASRWYWRRQPSASQVLRGRPHGTATHRHRRGRVRRRRGDRRDHDRQGILLVITGRLPLVRASASGR